MSTLAMCIGGPAAGSLFETAGRDVLFVAISWEPLRLDLVDPQNPAEPGSFAYRLVKIRVDGFEHRFWVHRFWVPRSTPVDGEAAFVMGSLVGGYRAPGDR